jgi:hypothetical protein
MVQAHQPGEAVFRSILPEEIDGRRSHWRPDWRCVATRAHICAYYTPSDRCANFGQAANNEVQK